MQQTVMDTNQKFGMFTAKVSPNHEITSKEMLQRMNDAHNEAELHRPPNDWDWRHCLMLILAEKNQGPSRKVTAEKMEKAQLGLFVNHSHKQAN